MLENEEQQRICKEKLAHKKRKSIGSINFFQRLSGSQDSTIDKRMEHKTQEKSIKCLLDQSDFSIIEDEDEFIQSEIAAPA